MRMPHRSVVLLLPPLLALPVVAAAPLLLVVVLVFAAAEELAVLAAAVAGVVGLPPRPSFSLSAAFPCTNHADADVHGSKEEKRGEVSKLVRMLTVPPSTGRFRAPLSGWFRALFSFSHCTVRYLRARRRCWRSR